MASLSSSTNANFPKRSISLPSRLNPNSIKIETQLYKLKTLETSLLSLPLSAEIVRSGFVGLAELYNCVEELVHSPLTQQTLIQSQNGNIIEEALDSSISFLDSCAIAQDLLSTLKENVRTLQSIFRRRGENSSIESGINTYINFQKIVKKGSAKCLRTLKKMENKAGSTSHFDANPYLSMVTRVLREVTSITISILQSVFMFLSVPISKKNSNTWSLISKVMLTRPSKINENILNEVESVDACLKRKEVNCDVEITRKRLEVLEHGLAGLEDELDCLFRRLIQNRVSLLNILVQ